MTLHHLYDSPGDSDMSLGRINDDGNAIDEAYASVRNDNREADKKVESLPMSTLNWDDNEAVVRARWPEAVFPAGVVWESSTARDEWGGRDVYWKAKGYLGKTWAEARQHPTVRAWEQENRPEEAVVYGVTHNWPLAGQPEGSLTPPMAKTTPPAASKLEPVGEGPENAAIEELADSLLDFMSASPSTAREARETAPEKVIWHIEMRTTDGSWYAFPFWEDETAIRKVYEQSEYPEVRLMRDVVISTITETRKKKASNV